MRKIQLVISQTPQEINAINVSFHGLMVNVVQIVVLSVLMSHSSCK